MMPNVELCEEFFSQVLAMDAELSRRVAAAGCPTCGGPLHQAHYQRKPRGGLIAAAGEAFSLRHSLCCGREGCRKRTLPPSFRFLGRRVYLEGVVLLAGMAVQLAAGALWAVSATTGVPSWTLRRWRRWWGETFPRSSTWRKLRALQTSATGPAAAPAVSARPTRARVRRGRGRRGDQRRGLSSGRPLLARSDHRVDGRLLTFAGGSRLLRQGQTRPR